MTIYRVSFIYGSRHLCADIERYRLKADDRRGFADLAQMAVHEALNFIPQVDRKFIAHDYEIFELTQDSNGVLVPTIVYSFDTLENE